MNPKYFDIHTHVHFEAFKGEVKDVIECALKENIWTIQVGTQKNTSRAAVELAESYEEGVYATVGLHPIHTDSSFHDKNELGEEGKEFLSRGEVFDYDYYRALAQSSKVVGIGECGLDYYRLLQDSKKKQKNVFENQIALANEINKPLMLHIRQARHGTGVGGQAYKDAYDILRSVSKVQGNVHFFAGTWEEAKLFLNLGFTLSFTGVITFADNYNEVIKNVPLNMIMVETDAPYVAPVPFRGKRNTPLYVKEVAKRISEIRGEDFEKVRVALVQNAMRLFV